MDEKEKLKMSKYSRKEKQLKEDIESIVENKDSENIRQRISRYETYYYNPAILPILFDVLQSDSYEEKVKSVAAVVLGSYFDEALKIVPKIMEALEKSNSSAVKKRLLESLVKFEGKAVTTIPKLETLIEKSTDTAFRIYASEAIETLKNPILYPTCPKCNKNSFAYHSIPTTGQVEQARKMYTHMVKGGQGSPTDRPVRIEYSQKTTFAAIVYCLNCGHIVSAIGGYK